MQAHLDAVVAALPAEDVLRVSGDEAAADPAAVAARIAVFLAEPEPAADAVAKAREAGLGGLPRCLPEGRHAAYAGALAAPFAALF